MEAMEIGLVQGRTFSERDSSAAPRVAIVNQALTRRLFGAEVAVGHRLAFGATPGDRGAEMEIVGVARDAKYTGLRQDPPPTVYLPAAQQLDGEANYCARVTSTPAVMFAAIRSAVREIDPTLPVMDLRTQEEQIARTSSQEQLLARLCGFFGIVALALTSVGLYGVTSYRVMRRTGEIGLRMALGALPGQVLGRILRESIATVSLGIGLGLAMAYGASRVVESMLFGIAGSDLRTYCAVSLVLAVTSLVASLVPARNATRVNPIVALRAD